MESTLLILLQAIAILQLFGLLWGLRRLDVRLQSIDAWLRKISRDQGTLINAVEGAE